MKKLLKLLSITVLIFGCSEDPESDDIALTCLLNHLEISEVGSQDSDDISFFYDDEGRITKIVEVEEYMNGGSVETNTEEYQFIYDAGKLTTMKEVMEDGNVSQTLQVSYDGELVSAVSIEDNEGYIYEYRFMYESGVLVKIENWHKDGTQFYLVEHEEFTYSQNNLTQISEFQANETTASETREITYDENLNPFKGNLAMLLWWGDFTRYISENNPLTVDETEILGNETYTYNETYAYEFDNATNLVEITLSSDGYEDIYTLTYDCE